MPYEWDVFLSYRRHGEWPLWVQNIFRPVFEHWLGEELPGTKVFVDYEIETGNSWPQRLGQALGQSKVLVPLFSRQYFSSRWCQLELAQMFARESGCGFRTKERRTGLVVPAHIHDGEGENFPVRAREIQAAKLQPYTNIRVSKESVALERLSEEIRNWVPDIANAIRSAPPYDGTWAAVAIEEFVREFASPEAKQLSPPSLG